MLPPPTVLPTQQTFARPAPSPAPFLQQQNVTKPAPTLAPPAQAPLSANKAVDLADSEHINITKSVYNATYNNPNQSLPSSQQNPSVFSFGSGQPVGGDVNRGSLQSNQSFGQIVNRSSGGASFNPNTVNATDPLANRISGGSVYDYDQLRDY